MMLVLCTAPAAAAERIAAQIVEERLAACVSVIPSVRSVYRWKGAVERADEAQLLMKTSEAVVDELIARIAAIHPYEMPEIIAFQVDRALPAYLAWVDEEARGGAGR